MDARKLECHEQGKKAERINQARGVFKPAKRTREGECKGMKKQKNKGCEKGFITLLTLSRAGSGAPGRGRTGGRKENRRENVVDEM